MRGGARNAGGFTLVELMIVMTIIAILAGVAIPNLLRSRMAANEAAGIAACRAYATAQNTYLRTDYDKDGVLEYASSINGPNGLFTDDPGNPGDLSLVDDAFAAATGDPDTATPKAGYVFSVLTGQSANAPGGAWSYIVRGNMTAGFGLSTIPQSYDGSGRNSYLVGKSGMVYQNDRGVAETTHLTVYDPDSNWVICE